MKPDHLSHPDPTWKPLYRIGGAAALAAGILFRRNLAAEVHLFNPQPVPETVEGWYQLLQASRFLGLVYLNLFDLVNFILVGLVFLALVIVLWGVSRGGTLTALALGSLGIAAGLASNPALSLLALSDQYGGAVSEPGRTALAAAGEALLATGRFTSPGAHPGTGGYLSLLLVAAASLIFSIQMFGSPVFNRWTPLTGIIASALDLGYCTTYLLFPSLDPEITVLIFIPAAGLFWMVWHILVGWRLFKMGK